MSEDNGAVNSLGSIPDEECEVTAVYDPFLPSSRKNAVKCTLHTSLEVLYRFLNS